MISITVYKIESTITDTDHKNLPPTVLFAAVKCIRKATLTAEDLAALETEVEAMRSLGDHPNFVRMYQYFEERDFFFIVLELISGR